MQAMDPAAADFYEEDGKDLDFYDFEPLPTLPEDEENVSLADILSLRDSGLSEREAWAVCLECSLSMRSVAHSAIFQTLCITPDTLAFNTSGNVCFMEQLSDDPEGAFVPPEFDVTGNTFEAHIYSLGATLKAALDYVTEPEPQPRLSRELEALLGQMQAEDPRDRPDLQSIIALCEEKMQLTSSCHLCQSLSAAGRRVLSIESFGAFQDVSEITWRERLAPKSVGPKRQPGDRSADPAALPALEGQPPSPARESLEHPGTPPSKALLSAPVKNGESPGQEGLVPERLACLLLDAQRPLGDPDRGFLERSRLRKVQTLPRLPPCSPEAGALCLSLTSTKTQPPAPEFFPPDPRKPFPEGKNGLTSSQAQPESSLWPERDAELRRVGDRAARGRGPTEESPLPGSKGPRDAGRDPGTPEPDDGTADRAGEPGGAALEQGVSLQDLLSKLGRPFKEYELWALSHACLSTLRTHGQHPAYLCLDSVLVAEDGTVLFGPPPASGAYNSFFLAPEVAEQKLTTEKASVYCVAAILWTAAKFSIPRDHKLALPRRLKTLLLHMARRSAQERPSAAEAIETCSGYLLHRGMDSRKILAHLRASTCTVRQEEETIGLQNAFLVAELSPSTAAAPRPGSAGAGDSPPPPHPTLITQLLSCPVCASVAPTKTLPHGPVQASGFLQISSDSRLVAVQGPVPGQPSCLQRATLLPEAFSSPATHFRPIVLAANAGVARDMLALTSGPAEGPEERRGRLDGEGDGKQAPETHGAATALKTPDQPAPGSPEPLRESVPRGSAQGCPSSPAPAPASPLEGAALVMPKSPAPPTTTQMPPPERGPKEPIPTAAACGGLEPRLPGPTAAPHSPCHPAKPPRGGATQVPGQEPEGPPSAPRSPSPATGSPDGPGGAPVREWDDRAPEGHLEWPCPADHKLCPSSADASPLSQGTACPSLQEATRLIQEEFAFDGYLDHGLEALIMGEYIYALKDLTYATFCGAISEKFCDLYWGERLLQNLFRVVNGRTSPSENTSEEAGPQPKGSGGTSAPSTCSPSSKRPSHLGAAKEKPSVDSDELSRSNFEVGFRPQKSVAAGREQPQAEEARQQGGGLAGGSEAVARLARPPEGGPSVSPGPGGLQSCSPGWCSAFYEADCFSADVHCYVKELARQKAAGCPTANAQTPACLLEPECMQELEQQLMIEKRNFRKTLKFYQKLLQKEKRNKGSEVKTMLSKLKGQLEEMRSKVQFLGLVKKYLQVMYAERWGLEPCALPVIVNIAAAPCDTLDFSPLDESSSLIFYNASKRPRGGRQRKARVLQAGTPLGLMAYLYSSDAFLEGYVQQFLYTFRYFCSPHDFLHFLLDRISSTLSRAHQDPASTSSKIYRRSLCLLQAWLEDCHAVDFRRDAGLLGRLQDYLASQILPLDGSAEPLLSLLEVGTERRAEGAPRSTDLQDPKEAEDTTRPLNALWKRLSEDGISRKSFPWRLSRGNGLALPHHKERQYSIASALPKPCFFEDFYGPYARASEKGPYFLTEYSTHQLFSQLTLLQQSQLLWVSVGRNLQLISAQLRPGHVPVTASEKRRRRQHLGGRRDRDQPHLQAAGEPALQISADREVLLRAEELRNSHADPGRPGAPGRATVPCLENSTRKDSRGHGGAESRGGLPEERQPVSDGRTALQGPAHPALSPPPGHAHPAAGDRGLHHDQRGPQVEQAQKHRQGGEPGPRVPGEPLHVRPRPQAAVPPQAEDRPIQRGGHLHPGRGQQGWRPPGGQREALQEDSGQAAENESHVPVAQDSGLGVQSTPRTGLGWKGPCLLCQTGTPTAQEGHRGGSTGSDPDPRDGARRG
ncbi:kinase non-catalytic C-lobe domain-containing protein 1 isoform X2 [Orcinus orca]|uniref:kinase non-catalytic C-lobe domain-containing protein 1 isoform X2 n=1 Tax=Orcinus orca TaxID=9733 RepID=UPI00211111D1|nr:kinase non-catalytic C-lobe domain-containing protein 1 isoform X2 [Orcinus orca]